MLDTEEVSASDRGSETVGFVRCKDLIVPSLREIQILAMALIRDHGFEFDPYFVNELDPVTEIANQAIEPTRVGKSPLAAQLQR
ncbi:hypothetical protein ACG02S_20855 [Roseateles sp. DC23W]|uniref:Uncharacterized protein n=1 Tax=Pelomonas dachongensis TaxID=3299029 RepID=A0ABW7EU42_9BURK